MTLEEKKKLYRASFCQTLVEVDAPTGEWKAVFGWVFVWVAVAVFSFVGVRKFCKYFHYSYFFIVKIAVMVIKYLLIYLFIYFIKLCYNILILIIISSDQHC